MSKSACLTKLLLAISVGFAACVPAAAADGDTYLIINGQKVPQLVADIFLEEQKQAGREVTPQLHKDIKEEIIRRTLLVQKAKESGLHKKTSVATQMEIASEAILIRALVAETINKTPPSDNELRKKYDQIVAQRGNVEYKTRHVLLKTEAQAGEVITRLKQGESISNLASESLDPGSRNKGGDLGWRPAAAFVKPFADALVGLEKGQYTQTPVESEFGYHVIMLEDRRNVTPPPFERVKPQLLQRFAQAELAKYVDKLREKARIE